MFLAELGMYFGIHFCTSHFNWVYDIYSKMCPVPQRHMMCPGTLCTLEDTTQKMQDTDISFITQSIPANKITINECVYILDVKKKSVLASIPKYIKHCLAKLSFCTFCIYLMTSFLVNQHFLNGKEMQGDL